MALLTTIVLTISIAAASILGILFVLGQSIVDPGVEKEVYVDSLTDVDGSTALGSDIRYINIGAINDDAAKSIERFQPTTDYVAKRLSNDQITYAGRVVVVSKAAEMIEKLSKNEVDIYFEGSFGAVAVNEATGASAELLRWKDGLSEYHSVFVVREDSDIRSIEDFKGRSIAFETPESTSSHLLPRAYLLDHGFGFHPADQSTGLTEPSTTALKYYFTGEDENTPYWVVENRVDIGAMSNINYGEIPPAVKASLRIVGETENVPRHVVSFRAGLDPSFVDAAKRILTEMESDPEGKVIMNDFQDTARYSEIPDRENTLANISLMLKRIVKDSGGQLPDIK